MPNTYFRFKQFIVHQQHCAMKVCTDACILGATANANGAENLLDIGAGTGLLSLIMAQRYPALKIDAIEIDIPAAKQAAENFEKSPWHSHLNIIKGDIRQFSLTSNKKYNHIICNPPFYDDHFKPKDKANTIARHNEQLTLKELAEIVYQLLSAHGKFSVLLPPNEMKQLEKDLLLKKIFYNEQLLISDREKLPVIRVVGEFSFNNTTTITTSLVIKKDKVHYTHEFKYLLKDFYLAF
jgi:tRNA1Val (adenine37-N6)-methyltransferase